MENIFNADRVSQLPAEADILAEYADDMLAELDAAKVAEAGATLALVGRIQHSFCVSRPHAEMIAELVVIAARDEIAGEE